MSENRPRRLTERGGPFEAERGNDGWTDKEWAKLIPGRSIPDGDGYFTRIPKAQIQEELLEGLTALVKDPSSLVGLPTGVQNTVFLLREGYRVRDMNYQWVDAVELTLVEHFPAMAPVLVALYEAIKWESVYLALPRLSSEREASVRYTWDGEEPPIHLLRRKPMVHWWGPGWAALSNHWGVQNPLVEGKQYP